MSHVNKPDPDIYVTSTGDKVVFLYDYYKDYLTAIRTNPKQRDSLYKAKVLEPIFAKYLLDTTPIDPPFIHDTVGFDSIITALEQQRAETEKIISQALTECRKDLSSKKSVFIYIKTAIPAMKKYMDLKDMGGIAGWTTRDDRISITIDPTIDGWRKMLKPTVAHEFTHIYCLGKIENDSSFKWTVLDRIIFEGLADSYAHSIYPNVKCPWTSALTKEAEISLWNKLKSKLYIQDWKLSNEILFGSDNYPGWGGYTLGYEIVQSALKNNPNFTIKKLMDISSEQILNMSDYKL